MKRSSSLVTVLAAVFGCATPALAQSLLDADFDDGVIDEPVGTGGAAAGEPVSVGSGVDAVVREGPFTTPSLELTDNSTSAAAVAFFEFIGSAEPTTGVVTINTRLWFDSLDNYILYVREQGSAAESFTSIVFASAGIVGYTDANTGPAGIVIGSYEAGRVYPVSVVFDLDAGTYDVYLDGCLALDDEPHGVTGRGIGSVLVGTRDDADLSGRFFVEDLVVCTGEHPIVNCADVCFVQADFDDKTVDAAIGTGGAAVGEPVSVSGGIQAVVRADPFPSPGLEISDNSPISAGRVRFELEGAAEITTGVVTINAALWFDSFDNYLIRAREQGTAAAHHSSVLFLNSGDVSVTDAGGSLGVVGTYETGRVFPFSLVFDLDAGTYDLYLDGHRVVEDEPHDVVGEGIGAVLFGMGSDGNVSGSFTLDDFSVCEGGQPIAECGDDCLVAADFDDKTIGVAIATGGAAVGEPVSVGPAVEAIVQATPFPTPSLEITDVSGASAGVVSFELLGSAEVTSGVFTISAELWFDVLDSYILRVREQGTFADQFVNVLFQDSGDVSVSDAGGSLGVVGSYETGRSYPVSLVYDQDAENYDLYLDGCLVVANETHGATGSGVGAVLFGMGFDADLSGRFSVDGFSMCAGEDPNGIVCCPGNADGDGDVDVDDLNNVILDWGTDGSAHGGDIAGPVPGSPPDGIVDVNDLNAVIVGWGACP